MSNREDALSLVCLIESAQYGLQFGDGSLRKGRALTTEEMRIIEKALYAYAVPVAAPSTAAEPKRCEYCDNTGDVHRADGEWLGECTVCKAEQQAKHQAEPALVQMRMRPMWREEGGGWTEWGNITEAAAQDYERHPIYQDWQYEVRRLYLGAQPGQEGETGADEPLPLDKWYRIAQEDRSAWPARNVRQLIDRVRQLEAAQSGQRAGAVNTRAAAMLRWVTHVLDDIIRTDSDYREGSRLNLGSERDRFKRALHKLHEAQALLAAAPTPAAQEGEQP